VAIGDNMSKRDQGMVGVAFIAVALAAAYWYFIFNPRSVELDARAQHVEQLESKNRKAKAEMAKGTVAELQRQAIEYQRNLEVMRQLVPMGNEVPALLDQVSTSARRVGLEIASVQPQAVVPGDQFDTHRYRIVIDGGYHKVGSFLANVGSLTRIIVPVGVKLTPAQAADKKKKDLEEARLRAEFEIHTYVARVMPPGDATGARP
jgi:type IV pilus assembly protein PilO